MGSTHHRRHSPSAASSRAVSGSTRPQPSISPGSGDSPSKVAIETVTLIGIRGGPDRPHEPHRPDRTSGGKGVSDLLCKGVTSTLSRGSGSERTRDDGHFGSGTSATPGGRA